MAQSLLSKSKSTIVFPLEQEVDIVRQTSKPNRLKRFWPLMITFFPVIYVAQYLYGLSQAEFSVSSDSMLISEVKRGPFTVSVRGSGILVPANIQWLAAQVDARVEQVVVKPGKQVRRGDLIVQLSNPQLMQQLEEIKWELEAMVAENKAQRVSQESALLDQKATVLNAKLDYEASHLRQSAQAKLYAGKSGAVSQIDFEQTRLETTQYEERWQIQQARFLKMQENIDAQSNARSARLNKTRKSLERIQQQVADLSVRASMDSVVQAVPIEPGQQIAMGSNIAKLAQRESLIAEIQIPEIQIRDVAIGQRVIIDTRNSKVEGRVSRIDPAVIKGNVQVDVEFSGLLPKDARPDLTIDGEIKIAEIADALHVERPLFAQSQSASSLYKVSKNGDYAERINVKLGQGSVNQIEIIAGLEVGDKIIVSDPSSWETYAKIRIN